ncbi:MAG TPA: CocE/NonD family hydrolase [Nocardioidaceae bacterium]|nr:CocE/NonD family hydrolase [Nocardioidaceae bacterium]
MRARRTASVLTATASLLAAGVAAGVVPSASASTPGYSLHHITVNVKVGPDGATSCLVNADIYKPDHTSRHHTRPAILTTNGFGGSKDDSNETAIGKGFVREGYVVMAYSGLGFGGSGCKIYLDDPDYDGKAGSQLVDVLAGKHPYTSSATGRTHRIHYVAKNAPGDPKVGMIGGSYGGEIQFAVAEQDPRVDAIIPIITWNDLSYSLAPNNTDFAHGVTYRTPGVAKKEWTGLFFGEGVIDGVEGAQVDPSRVFPPCPNFADDVCASAAKLLTLGYPDPTTLRLARHASVATYMHRINVPTLLAQGEQDTLFNLQEAVATFRALRKQGTPVRMIWQSWGHSHSTPAPGELDFGAKSLRASFEGRRFLSWMDHYVKGDSSAPVGPRFAYFRNWVHYDTSADKAGRAVEKAYAARSTFSQKPTASLFFTGSDALTPSRSAVQSGSKSYANASGAPTSYSETSGLEGNQVNQQPSDTPGTFAGFTSKPLAHGVAMVGSPRLTLHLKAPVAALSESSGPGGKLILFAKVYDVAPDGTAILPARLIAPVRVADVTKPVHVTLPGVVHRFAKGHRIRVVIAASDFAYANNATVQPVTVTTSRSAPSVVRLPLTGSLRFR